ELALQRHFISLGVCLLDQRRCHHPLPHLFGQGIYSIFQAIEDEPVLVMASCGLTALARLMSLAHFNRRSEPCALDCKRNVLPCERFPLKLRKRSASSLSQYG